MRIPVPGSKSEAIRCLVAAALARGTTRIVGAPESGDVRAVAQALRALGIRLTGRYTVRGGRLPAGDRTLHLGGSATGLRILAMVAALRDGRTVLDGDASLRRRPLGPVPLPVKTRGGRPPIVVEGPVRMSGPVRVSARDTSQFASGLLLAGFRIRLEGPVVSAPYIAMTMSVLLRFGGPGPRRIRIEPDWSSAAYPLVAAAVRGVRVRVPGLRADSLQADRAVIGLLEAAGVPCGVDRRGAWCAGTGAVRPFTVDLRDSPDLAPAAAALALFADGESRVTGAAHLRGKESDRIASCVAAVRAMGGKARATRDGFVIRGGRVRRGTVDPRGDHRIALAFGAVGARVLDRDCVAKSWPTAWADLACVLGNRGQSPLARSARKRGQSLVGTGDSPRGSLRSHRGQSQVGTGDSPRGSLRSHRGQSLGQSPHLGNPPRAG